MIGFAIQSFGQTNYKSVPDSLVCITPQQDIFFITQSFTIKELQSSLVLKNKTISILNDESKMLRSESSEKQKEIDLHILNENNLKSDISFIDNKLKKANRKTIVFKGVAIGLAVFSIVELGYIAVTAIQR